MPAPWRDHIPILTTALVDTNNIADVEALIGRRQRFCPGRMWTLPLSTFEAWASAAAPTIIAAMSATADWNRNEESNVTATHPHWCSAASCTADSATLTDLRYHRSEPVVVPTDDPCIKIYIYRTSDPDGHNEYVEVAELEEPVIEPWYLHDPRDKHGAELSMRVGMADRVQSAIAVFVQG